MLRKLFINVLFFALVSQWHIYSFFLTAFNDLFYIFWLFQTDFSLRRRRQLHLTSIQMLFKLNTIANCNVLPLIDQLRLQRLEFRQGINVLFSQFIDNVFHMQTGQQLHQFTIIMIGSGANLALRGCQGNNKSYLIQFDSSVSLLLSPSSFAVSAVSAVTIFPSEDRKRGTNLLDSSSRILCAGGALMTFLFIFIIRISNEIYILKRKPHNQTHFPHYSSPSFSLIYITCIFKNPKMSEKSTIEQDRQRSDLLRKQLSQMGEDFQFMKKNKQEWKKQLDAHFQDIQRKIQSSKQYIANQAKRTNDTLLAFQHKFEFEIKKTRDDLQNNINALTKDTTAKFQQKNKEVADLNKELTEEAKNRNNQFEEGQRQTKEKIDKTNQAIDKERQARIASEKENMGKMNESLFLLKEQLKDERDERNLKIKELEKNTNHELSSQRKFNEEFHNKTFNEFKEDLGSLRSEMQARFSSKDEIINSLTKVVKTLQDTLRHPI